MVVVVQLGGIQIHLQVLPDVLFGEQSLGQFLFELQLFLQQSFVIHTQSHQLSQNYLHDYTFFYFQFLILALLHNVLQFVQQLQLVVHQVQVLNKVIHYLAIQHFSLILILRHFPNLLLFIFFFFFFIFFFFFFFIFFLFFLFIFFLFFLIILFVFFLIILFVFLFLFRVFLLLCLTVIERNGAVVTAIVIRRQRVYLDIIIRRVVVKTIRRVLLDILVFGILIIQSQLLLQMHLLQVDSRRQDDFIYSRQRDINLDLTRI